MFEGYNIWWDILFFAVVCGTLLWMRDCRLIKEVLWDDMYMRRCCCQGWLLRWCWFVTAAAAAPRAKISTTITTITKTSSSSSFCATVTVTVLGLLRDDVDIIIQTWRLYIEECVTHGTLFERGPFRCDKNRQCVGVKYKCRKGIYIRILYRRKRAALVKNSMRVDCAVPWYATNS